MSDKKIFIATHSNLSEGFRNAAKLIVGSSADDITAFSLYEGQSADDFRDEIKRYKHENPSTVVVVLTDLYGASLFNAMLTLHNTEGIYVLTGVNLSLVLDLLLEEREIDAKLINEKITASKNGFLLLEKFDIDAGDEF